MQPISIGIDVGGTHTDISAVQGARVVRFKSPTTHENYSNGIFDALEGISQQLGQTVDEMMRNHCRAFVNGSTIVTNSLAEMKGAKVGVLVTAGFADILRLGRGARLNVRDDHLQRNLPQVVPRDRVIEIDERIDRNGNIVVPISRAQVEEAVGTLINKHVDCIAVCFLWSVSNEVHETLAGKVIQERAPGVFVTRSVGVSPVFREFERWQTAILNCYVQPPVKNFVDSVVAGLRKHGYRQDIEFFNGLGGVLTAEVAKQAPIQLYSSGPAGGAIASAALARRYELAEVLCGDMGGTSFDTILIRKYTPKVVHRCSIGPFDTAISLLDIASIGAGGGSIVSLDSRGVPQVGPQSAGSMPGPVCFGRGGTRPTLTDCTAVMGFIDPENYLGGKFVLDVEAATAALLKEVGDPLGWDAIQTAAGAYELVVANMANALRTESVSRGRDPRRCAFIAYGGALPVYAASICRRLGISDMIIPGQSSAFSAYGMLESNYVRREAATLGWVVGEEPGYDHMRAACDRLEKLVRDDLLNGAGFDEEHIKIEFGGDFRYAGQLAELYMAIAREDIDTDLGAGIIPTFNEIYEKEFGPDTAWRESKLMLVNFVVVGTGIRQKPTIDTLPVEPRDVSTAILSRRRLFLPEEREWAEIPVYDASKLFPGAELDGPAIVDCWDTTIYVPPRSSLRRDEHDNFRMRV